MDIKGRYDDEQPILKKEVFYFDIEKEETINFHIKKAPYYHNTITIYNPYDERVGHFSFKTINKKFHIPTGVVAGRWRVEITDTMKFVGDFHIEITQGNELKDSISLIHSNKGFDKKHNKEKKWYRGDFHLHTDFSDGSHSLEEIVKNCGKKNLEVVAITDHNVMHSKTIENSPLVLPSTELTLDDKGHFNLHGLKEEFDFSKTIDIEKSIPKIIENFLKRSRGKDMVTCLNHPFARGTALLYDISLEDLSLMEVLRSPRQEKNDSTNNQTIKGFDYLWERGYKIYAIGGSDSHLIKKGGKEIIATPTTHLYLDGLSIKNTLTSMKQGKTYMTVETDIDLKILSDGKIILPGEKVDEEVRYEIKGSETLRWNTIIQGEIVDSIEGKDLSIFLNLEEGQYGRVEARDEEGNIKVFINPNYRGEVEKLETRWFQVREHVLSF